MKNWYKISQSKPFKYLGQCDQLRKTPEGKDHWNNMVSNHIKVPQEEFISQCDLEPLLDEGETLEGFFAADDDTFFAKSKWGVQDCYYIMTHGFEFIFTS